MWWRKTLDGNEWQKSFWKPRSSMSCAAAAAADDEMLPSQIITFL
jgi:hypothetical protein